MFKINNIFNVLSQKAKEAGITEEQINIVSNLKEQAEQAVEQVQEQLAPEAPTTEGPIVEEEEEEIPMLSPEEINAIINSPAIEESPVAEQPIKEEPIMTEPKQPENVVAQPPLAPQQEAMVQTLMTAGVTRDVAIAQLQALAGIPTEAPTIKAPTTETPTVEQPKKEEKKMKETKPWFKRAVGRMTMFDKQALIVELIREKTGETNPEIKAEIQKEIDRLRTEEGRFEKMKAYIGKAKGWTIDATGKVAEALYLTGDYAGKGASNVTKVTGKAIQGVGNGIAKTGEFVVDQADNVGKIAEAPFKLTGDIINTANGTGKRKEDSTPSTKKPIIYKKK